jgi:hypothetical protein
VGTTQLEFIEMPIRDWFDEREPVKHCEFLNELALEFEAAVWLDTLPVD